MRRFAFLFMLAWCAAARALALEAGAAKLDITLPLGVPLNGYFDRLGRGALAVHDPIWARCLYLSDGATSVFLVNADLCAINRELRDRVLELAPQDIPKENVILTATHNHSAQGAMMKGLLFRSVSGRFMPEVLESTAKACVEVMRTAYANRRRAVIGYGTTTQNDLSTNRRFDNGPMDPQLGAIRVEDPDGAAIAILANFAAHPTTVSGDDMFTVSADYPGFYYAELEQLSSAGCVAMFLNGAEGNQQCAGPPAEDGWERTALIGRLLAMRVSELAETLPCAEAQLHFAYSTPSLPPTLGDRFMPASTTVQALEIGDLLMTFFPGEPCVEIGLELRRRALDRGYSAQFSVGLSNDYLLYFVPRSLYGKLIYENAMNMYGPRIEDWFYREFSKLMTRGGPDPERAKPQPVEVQELTGGFYVHFAGTPYEIGFQRGAAFQSAVQESYKRTVVEPCDSGALIPKTGLWQIAPSFINLTPLALPRLAIGARPMLDALSESVFNEVEGLADGAGMPFDAAWLVQCMPTYAAHEDVESIYRSPFCTMVAAVGDRAGADDLLIGRNLDWPTQEPVVVADTRPNTGHGFVQVGFPSHVGVFSGMNDAGVVVCVERAEALGKPGIDGPPVELALRDVLQTSGDFKDAMARIRAVPHLRGYRVLVGALHYDLAENPGKSDKSTKRTKTAKKTRKSKADKVDETEPAAEDEKTSEKKEASTDETAENRPPKPKGPVVRVLECGAGFAVREPLNGLLLGADIESDPSDAEALARYGRVARVLGEERIIAANEIRSVLRDAAPEQSGRARICNEDTRYSVVFEPKSRRVSVCIGPSGGPAEFHEFSLAEGGP